MTRKQVGAIDADLLAEVDKRAEWMGQTRRVFVERALQARLAGTTMKINGEVQEPGQPVWVPAPTISREAEARPVRSSAQAKSGRGPYPKKGK